MLPFRMIKPMYHTTCFQLLISRVALYCSCKELLTLIGSPPAAALAEISSRSHLQALNILYSAKASGALNSNVAALSELVAAVHTPLTSRLKALEWLLDLLPQIVRSSGQKLSSEAGSSTDTEGGVEHFDPSDTATDSRSSDSADLAAGLQRLSLSEYGRGSADTQASSADLVNNIWAALLLAVEAKEREVRLAAAKALQQSLNIQGLKLGPGVVASLVAVASERLCDVDSRVQSAWRLLLPELLLRNVVSCKSCSSPQLDADKNCCSSRPLPRLSGDGCTKKCADLCCKIKQYEGSSIGVNFFEQVSIAKSRKKCSLLFLYTRLTNHYY